MNAPLYVWVWYPDQTGGFHAIVVAEIIPDNAGYGLTWVKAITPGDNGAPAAGELIIVATKHIVYG
jgi:hypothetical protein